jgi:hypothetical protein
MIPDYLKIQKLKADLAAAEAIKQEWDAKPDDEFKLAELLHERLCRWNHTDGCSWFYEFADGRPNWSGYARKDWLANAIEFLTAAEKVFEAMKKSGKGYKRAETLIENWPNVR